MSGYAEFTTRLTARHPGIEIQARPTIGKANSARFLYSGFKAGMPNLLSRLKITNALSGSRKWALMAKVLVPGLTDAELYIGLVFADADLVALEQRLIAIEAETPGRTNNTRFMLHAEGCFVTVVSEEETVDPNSDRAGYGDPVPVTEILYADVERDGRLIASELDIVERLRRNYSNPERIIRLEPAGATVEPIANPASMDLATITAKIAELGVEFDDRLVAAYHLSLVHNPRKHFVILRGISGTGKSLLAKAYAYSVLAADSLQSAPARFLSVAVEPQWTDPTFLLGYEDVLAPDGYRRTAFVDALMLAASDPTRPVFVLLDEMNRAQVEHYFSPFLSAMENQSPIRLRSSVTPSSVVPTEVAWPENFYLTGTVNDDESVIAFSTMVLDRANTIDLSEVDIRAFGEWLRDQEPDLKVVLADPMLDRIVAIHETLKLHTLHFGRRTVREIGLYMSAAHRMSLDITAVLDEQIDQKILPRLQGGEELRDTLDSLKGHFADLPRSLARVERMQADLETYDFFKYR